jgi:prophage tail gpP-like protein
MIDVTLKVNGSDYKGWKTIDVSSVWSNRRIIQPYGFGSLHGQDKAWPILPGNKCTVLLGETTVITGYVDEANPDTILSVTAERNRTGTDRRPG